MTPSSVKVQVSPESVPSTPSWFGEVTLIAHVFTQRGLLSAIVERVRFARARFGTYDTIDFVVVLLGYAVSGERTLEEFYERLEPFGQEFMSPFGRADLPSRSALSQYLSALDQPAVEAWRTLFNVRFKPMVLYALFMRLASVIVGPVPCVQHARDQTKALGVLAGSVPSASL